MKSFKGSSNKLGPLGFHGKGISSPLLNGTFRAGYTHRDKGHTILSSSSPFCSIKVTTNKLEKALILD
jgi:hypothetical protein